MLKPRAEDRERFDLWAMDTSNGQLRMLVDSTKIGGGEISEAEKMRRERARVGGSKGIVEYEWAPDGKSVLAPVDGDLYLADVGDGRDPAADEHAGHGNRRARLGRRALRQFRPRPEPLRDRPRHRRANGRSRAKARTTSTCGTAEFVAQEEMDRHTGTWWSPSDGRVAVECYDESKVEVVTRAAIGAEWDQGVRPALSGCRDAQRRWSTLWVIDPTSGRRSKVDLGTNPDIYLARVDWAKDGRALYVQRESRDQKRLDMLAVDPAPGASRILFSETREDLDQPQRRLQAAERRQPDLGVGAKRVSPSLSLRERAMDAGHARRLGR